MIRQARVIQKYKKCIMNENFVQLNDWSRDTYLRSAYAHMYKQQYQFAAIIQM